MKNIALILSLLLSFSSFALSNSNYYKVTHIYSWEDGSVHLWLEANGGEHQCQNKQYPTRYLMYRHNTTEFDQKFSLLLTARTSNLPIKLEYNCDSNGVPRIQSIRL